MLCLTETVRARPESVPGQLAAPGAAGPRKDCMADGPGKRMSNFGRNLALWVIIALLLVVLFNLFQPGTTQTSGARRWPIRTSSAK